MASVTAIRHQYNVGIWLYVASTWTYVDALIAPITYGVHLTDLHTSRFQMLQG